MRIEDYYAMREIRINKWFNVFLTVLVVLCLILIVFMHYDTAQTFRELDAVRMNP